MIQLVARCSGFKCDLEIKRGKFKERRFVILKMMSTTKPCPTLKEKENAK
jgi:hypothetical protein